jgi:hypothetical protein
VPCEVRNRGHLRSRVLPLISNLVSRAVKRLGSKVGRAVHLDSSEKISRRETTAVVPYVPILKSRYPLSSLHGRFADGRLHGLDVRGRKEDCCRGFPANTKAEGEVIFCSTVRVGGRFDRDGDYCGFLSLSVLACRIIFTPKVPAAVPYLNLSPCIPVSTSRACRPSPSDYLPCCSQFQHC